MFTEELWERLNNCKDVDSLYKEIAILKTELDEIAEELIFYNDWEKDIRKRWEVIEMIRIIDYAIRGCERDLRLSRKKGDTDKIAFYQKELKSLKSLQDNPTAFAVKRQLNVC